MRILVALITLTFPLCLYGQEADYELETVAENLSHPWSLAFLPNGDYLLSEKSGSLRIVTAGGDVGEPLDGVPPTYFAGQGGFFDVVLDPDFEDSGTIYLAFAHGTADANATRVVRARLTDGAIVEVTTIFTVTPLKDTTLHFGGKMAFLADGTLLLTTGDGSQYREAAMDPFSQMGKVIRINPDGSVPSDNPFANGDKGDPAVYTLGNRNPQGLAVDHETGIIWEHEHGAQGGDELNMLEPGANYGWPATTHGINYTGALISPFETAPGIEPPVIHWTPSIAPSGLALYKGEKFPEWEGDLFVGALVDRDVKRLELAGTEVVNETSLFGELGERIRDVRVSPDGYLYLLTDREGGKIIRVRPR